MVQELSLEIVTPNGLAFQENVYEVILPTVEGQIGVLPQHIPLVTIIKPGIISVKRTPQEPEENWEHLATAGGFADIDGKRVRVLADTAERADDIDEMQAKEALKKAQEMQQSNKDQVSLADATSLIELNTARLKVAELRRRRRV